MVCDARARERARQFGADLTQFRMLARHSVRRLGVLASCTPELIERIEKGLVDPLEMPPSTATMIFNLTGISTGDYELPQAPPMPCPERDEAAERAPVLRHGISTGSMPAQDERVEGNGSPEGPDARRQRASGLEVPGVGLIRVGEEYRLLLIVSGVAGSSPLTPDEAEALADNLRRFAALARAPGTLAPGR